MGARQVVRLGDRLSGTEGKLQGSSLPAMTPGRNLDLVRPILLMVWKI